MYKVGAELVRVHPRLDGKLVIGFRMKEEPDPVHELIQKVQTSRGIVKEAENASTESRGIEKNEGLDLIKELEEIKKSE